MLAFIAAMATKCLAQSKVTTGGKKYVLIEESTGSWCPWCPDGAQVIEEKLLPHGTDTNYSRAVFASFHLGADKMAIPNNPFGAANFGAGTPSANIDRVPHYWAPTTVGMNRGLWEGAMSLRYGNAPNFDVSMICLYDTATRIITIKVKAKALVALTGEYRINAYVTEDSISSGLWGYNQNVDASYTAAGGMSSTGSPSWFVGKTSPMASASDYCHMAVVRKVLATTAGAGIWGDMAFAGTIAAGDSFEKTYYDTIPVTYQLRTCYPKYTKVIGMVQKYSSDKLDRPIENCIEAKVRYMTKTLPNNVATISNVRELALFPIPAKDRLVIKAVLETPTDADVIITDAAGRTVYTRHYNASGSVFDEMIPITNLTDGQYVVRLTTGSSTMTKMLVVSR